MKLRPTGVLVDHESLVQALNPTTNEDSASTNFRQLIDDLDEEMGDFLGLSTTLAELNEVPSGYPDNEPAYSEYLADFKVAYYNVRELSRLIYDALIYDSEDTVH